MADDQAKRTDHAFSLTLSLYLQAARTFGSDAFAAASAGAFLAACALAWGVLPWRRARRNGHAHAGLLAR